MRQKLSVHTSVVTVVEFCAQVTSYNIFKFSSRGSNAVGLLYFPLPITVVRESADPIHTGANNMLGIDKYSEVLPFH